MMWLLNKSDNCRVSDDCAKSNATSYADWGGIGRVPFEQLQVLLVYNPLG